MRIVSLLPSATEIVYALGLEPVAVSRECDHPPAAARKPTANRTRVDPDATSAGIDEQVAAAEREGGVYELRTDVLREVDPDLILTQGVCDVCAVDDALVEATLEELDLDARIVSTHPHTLEDVLEDVVRIGEATGREERARSLVADLTDRIDRIERAAEGIEARPRVAVLDWADPPMVAGHWIPGMVEAAGGAYGLADPGERSTPREWDEIRAYDPEVLVVAPCGFDLEGAVGALPALAERGGWAELRAVRDGRVYAMDGDGHVNRPGPRLVDTLEALAGLIHPERFDRPPAGVARAVERTTA